MSIPVVAFFNNKGGVGKTSLVYHLSWMFSEMGIRVIAADLDPQANLTAAFVKTEQLVDLWEQDKLGKTIYTCLLPLVERTGDIAPIELLGIDDNLMLIPGDLRLSSFEMQLSDEWANTILGEISGLRLTSAMWRLVQQAADTYQAQVILVDMGPNLGAINRTILISSDYIVVPLAPDLFSLRGLINLGPTLRDWRKRWHSALDASHERKLNFALPTGRMKPIGYVILQHTERANRVVEAYQRWVERIPQIYREYILDQPTDIVEPLEIDQHLLGLVKHYRSLMVMAQEANKPIFHLKPADGAVGSHVHTVNNAYDNFNELAKAIANRINLPISQEDE